MSVHTFVHWDSLKAVRSCYFIRLSSFHLQSVKIATEHTNELNVPSAGVAASAFASPSRASHLQEFLRFHAGFSNCNFLSVRNLTVSFSWWYLCGRPNSPRSFTLQSGKNLLFCGGAAATTVLCKSNPELNKQT